MNKVIIGILVLLLAGIGVLGFYSYNFDKQIGTLSDELAIFKGETAAQIGTLSDELSDEVATLRRETAAQIGTLSDELSDELTTFKGETAAQISPLTDELEGVSSQISQSVINVSELYEKVKRSVVEVIDEEERVGSGFVFEADGYIVTNYHVVERATAIDVVLYDGTISTASIIGSCRYSDIAVLKLEREANLESLELADSNAVAIGEPVIVIGSPFDLPGTVTSGIISQKGRFETFAEEEPYYIVANLIQYSAASNPGNSGGPLLNSKGEVVGLVTAGVLPWVGEGIFYASSSNKVNRVARSLIDHGSFDNPTLLGKWTLEDLTPEKARAKNLETTAGILVSEASAASGFEADDVIVAIDGVTVRDAADLFNYLGEYKSPGDTVTLTAISGRGEIEISVKLVEGGVVLSGEAFQRW